MRFNFPSLIFIEDLPPLRHSHSVRFEGGHRNNHPLLFLRPEIVGNKGKRKEEAGPDEISFRSGPDHFVLGCAQKFVAGGGQAFQDRQGKPVFPFARRNDGLNQARLLQETDVVDDVGIAARKLSVLCPKQEITHKIEVFRHYLISLN